MEAGLSQRRFTVEEFHRIVEAGIVNEDDRVELIDGRIVEMAPIGSRHAACVKRLNLLFVERFARQLMVGVQDPLHLDARTELVPDLTLSRFRDDFYAGAHPRPADVLLVIEVADTTLDDDRRIKIPRYGRAGIQEAWLVNLLDRTIEVFREPMRETGYGDVSRVPEGQTIESSAVPGLSAKVEELLP